VQFLNVKLFLIIGCRYKYDVFIHNILNKENENKYLGRPVN